MYFSSSILRQNGIPPLCSKQVVQILTSGTVSATTAGQLAAIHLIRTFFQNSCRWDPRMRISGG